MRRVAWGRSDAQSSLRLWALASGSRALIPLGGLGVRRLRRRRRDAAREGGRGWSAAGVRGVKAGCGRRDGDPQDRVHHRADARVPTGADLEMSTSHCVFGSGLIFCFMPFHWGVQTLGKLFSGVHALG